MKGILEGGPLDGLLVDYTPGIGQVHCDVAEMTKHAKKTTRDGVNALEVTEDQMNAIYFPTATMKEHDGTRKRVWRFFRVEKNTAVR